MLVAVIEQRPQRGGPYVELVDRWVRLVEPVESPLAGSVSIDFDDRADDAWEWYCPGRLLALVAGDVSRAGRRR